MVSRTVHVVPEFERVFVLRLGEFVGVQGSRSLWIIPYSPFCQSVASILDICVETRVIIAAHTLAAANVPIRVEAVIFWRVEDPREATLRAADYGQASSRWQIAL